MMQIEKFLSLSLQKVLWTLPLVSLRIHVQILWMIGSLWKCLKNRRQQIELFHVVCHTH